MANYLVLIHGCIEPEIIGPIHGPIGPEIVKQIRNNSELRPEGLDAIFLLEINGDGVPEMTAFSGAYMDRMRSRAERAVRR